MRHYFNKQPVLNDNEVINAINRPSHPLQSKAGLQPLLDRIGDAHIVMPEEASMAHMNITPGERIFQKD